MSRLGVEIVSNACQSIIMAMQSDMLDDTELKELQRIFRGALDICDKSIDRLESRKELVE